MLCRGRGSERSMASFSWRSIGHSRSIARLFKESHTSVGKKNVWRVVVLVAVHVTLSIPIMLALMLSRNVAVRGIRPLVERRSVWTTAIADCKLLVFRPLRNQ